jgi:hypothetical protein
LIANAFSDALLHFSHCLSDSCQPPDPCSFLCFS